MSDVLEKSYIVQAQGAAGTFAPSHDIKFEEGLKGSFWKGPALR